MMLFGFSEQYSPFGFDYQKWLFIFEFKTDKFKYATLQIN